MPVSITAAVARFIAETLVFALLIGAITFGLHAYGDKKLKEGDALGYQRGHAEAQDVQIRWDADKQAWSASLETQHRDAEQRSIALNATIERITHDRDTLRTQLRTVSDAVGNQRDQLRNQSGAFVASALSEAGSAGDCDSRVARVGEAAKTLRELFDASSAAYVGMAEEAESSRAAGFECEQRYDALKGALESRGLQDGQ